MFFENPNGIEPLSDKASFSIFLLPKTKEPDIKSEILVEPDEKNKIGIEKIRDVISQCTNKQNKSFRIVVKHAEQLNHVAQNAILKFLEEPLENYHIVFFTENLEMLLPTVLSRANIYILKEKNFLDKPVSADEKVKNYAKKMLAASGKKLVDLSEEITSDIEYKKKDGSRTFVLSICETAIEMSYKSFFLTSNKSFLKKMGKILKLHDNIKQNGNIKLHLVADLC